MAKIYFLREGSGPERGTGGFDIEMEKLLARVGGRAVRHAGNQPPTFPAEREDLTPYRDPSSTLAQISAGEVNQKFPEEGFYVLEGIEPKEASTWS